jgi:hypothetical protein
VCSSDLRLLVISVWRACLASPAQKQRTKSRSARYHHRFQQRRRGHTDSLKRSTSKQDTTPAKRTSVVAQMSKALLLTRSAATPPCKCRGGASTRGFHMWRAEVPAASLSARIQVLCRVLTITGTAKRTVAARRVASNCGRLNSSWSSPHGAAQKL